MDARFVVFAPPVLAALILAVFGIRNFGRSHLLGTGLLASGAASVGVSAGAWYRNTPLLVISAAVFLSGVALVLAAVVTALKEHRRA